MKISWSINKRSKSHHHLIHQNCFKQIETMNWDHQLSRRFSSTSHFRLLNQLRSELRANPLLRDAKTSKLILQAKLTQNTNIKDNKKFINNNHPSRNLENNFNNNSDIDSSNASFLDRLNAIDLR